MKCRLHTCVLLKTLYNDSSASTIYRRDAESACRPLTLPPVGSSQDNTETIRVSQPNSGTNEFTEWPLTPSISPNTDRLRSRELTDQGWQIAILRGQELWDQLQQTLQIPFDSDAVICGIADRWSIEGTAKHKLEEPWSEPGLISMLPDSIRAEQFYHIALTAPKRQAGALEHDDFINANSYSPAGAILVTDAVGYVVKDARLVRAPDRCKSAPTPASPSCLSKSFKMVLTYTSRVRRHVGHLGKCVPETLSKPGRSRRGIDRQDGQRRNSRHSRSYQNCNIWSRSTEYEQGCRLSRSGPRHILRTSQLTEHYWHGAHAYTQFQSHRTENDQEYR